VETLDGVVVEEIGELMNGDRLRIFSSTRT